VNFGLRVVGRRADGYHELESVFLPLDLADRVELEAEAASRTGIHLELVGAPAEVPADARNLAVRAAEAFLAESGLAARISIRLTKQIPAAAGLGGGSSDAGAVLRGLARGFPGAVDPDGLERMALALGADVPFFLDPRPALVRGIGERCEPLAAGFSGHALLLANPGAALATARVFEGFDAEPAPPRPGELAACLARARSTPGDPAALAALLANDLEPVAARLCPAVGELVRDLVAQGALAAALSGSGATVFGVYPGAREAEAARARLAAKGAPDLWLRVARTLESG
jgi:4-diphosphocytidyl-2-C-methyl-D-erythritol kinase